MGPFDTVIHPQFSTEETFHHYPADTFPTIHPIHWLHSHFAVGGWSPLQRLSGMLTAHMTRIAPQNGFTWHPHRALEIYTWVLDGELYHEDTTGGKGVINPGEIQRMFSGDWIQHQELNLTDQPTRVIQIWFVSQPQYHNLEPHYQQLPNDALPRTQIGDAGVYTLIGDDSPMERHVDARLTATELAPGGKTTLQAPRDGEDLFLYVTDSAGRIRYDGRTADLGLYDVILARPEVDSVEISSDEGLSFLSFYLPKFLNGA